MTLNRPLAGSITLSVSSAVKARVDRAVLGRAALFLAALAYLGPLVYFVLGSFKPDQAVIDGLRGFLPVDLTGDNYLTLATRTLNSESTGYLCGGSSSPRSW